jgi:5'-methylthioadenosine phosphorylase
LVDKFIDRTRGSRASTFFGEGVVAHVPFGDPVCETLRGHLRDASREAGATVHDGGTYVVMEGPAFSTRAESELYRSWGASVIGMTNLPEAKLAREAEISYATLAMATDYDCWHPGHDDVNVEQVVAVINANVNLAKRIVAAAVPHIASHEGPCPQYGALQGAIMTAPDAMNPATRDALAPLIGRYV